jgi:hypothetical protein
MNKRGPKADAEAVRSSARDLLGIPNRAEAGKDVPVPGLATQIRVRILSQRQTREAHKAARRWCQANGFNPDASEGTNSFVEFTNASATQFLVRACLNPKGLFPLWGDGEGGKVHDSDPDPEEELADDLTREQIAFLESKRQEFQRDVAPALEEATPALIAEVIRTAKKGRRGETIEAFFVRSPRSSLLIFARTLDAQLATLTGWTWPSSSADGLPAGDSSAASD